jgi:hypothetical protein
MSVAHWLRTVRAYDPDPLKVAFRAGVVVTKETYANSTTTLNKVVSRV